MEARSRKRAGGRVWRGRRQPERGDGDRDRGRRSGRRRREECSPPDVCCTNCSLLEKKKI